MHILYLHGLASSPASAKATFFKEKLSKEGHTFDIPDLNLPSFDQLSFKAIVRSAEDRLAAAGPGPVVMMGSSLGALAALHLENALQGRSSPLKGLVLLAPAFDFRHNKRLTPDVLAKWKRTGKISMHHSATQSERDLPHTFLEELESLPPLVAPAIPALIIHGSNDEVIGVEHSRAFAGSAASIHYVEVESDHSMLSAFPIMLPALREFLTGL